MRGGGIYLESLTREAGESITVMPGLQQIYFTHLHVVNLQIVTVRPWALCCAERGGSFVEAKH